MSYEYHIGDIKKNDIVCEFDGYGYGIRMVALEDGHLDEDQTWRVECQNIKTKEKIVLAVHKDWLHYGPELYLNDIPYLNVKYL